MFEIIIIIIIIIKRHKHVYTIKQEKKEMKRLMQRFSLKTTFQPNLKWHRVKVRVRTYSLKNP